MDDVMVTIGYLLSKKVSTETVQKIMFFVPEFYQLEWRPFAENKYELFIGLNVSEHNQHGMLSK